MVRSPSTHHLVAVNFPGDVSKQPTASKSPESRSSLKSYSHTGAFAIGLRYIPEFKAVGSFGKQGVSTCVSVCLLQVKVRRAEAEAQYGVRSWCSFRLSEPDTAVRRSFTMPEDGNASLLGLEIPCLWASCIWSWTVERQILTPASCSEPLRTQKGPEWCNTLLSDERSPFHSKFDDRTAGSNAALETVGQD